MNTIIHSPTWATTSAQPGSLAGDLQQLINMAGPLACGMAVALRAVRRAQLAEDDGETPFIDDVERGHLVDLCAVSAQLLGAAATDACNTLIVHQSEQSAP